jgi:c-di-AMP phosphodiesterase-like protein
MYFTGFSYCNRFLIFTTASGLAHMLFAKFSWLSEFKESDLVHVTNISVSYFKSKSSKDFSIAAKRNHFQH